MVWHRGRTRPNKGRASSMGPRSTPRCSGRLFAIYGGWFSLIRAGEEAAFPELKEAQKKAEAELALARARRLPHRPQGKLVIRDVSVFDAESARLDPHRDVLVEGNRIVS